MDKIIYVGDLHGDINALAKLDEFAVKNSITNVVQVGDFGYRWPGVQCKLQKYFNKRARQKRPGPVWWTCGGNHENWPLWESLEPVDGMTGVTALGPGVNYVQRGYTVELDGKSHLFCGGAESTDKGHRREGISWWPQETPSSSEFRRFAYSLADDKPDVVVTHDAPVCVQLYRAGPTGQIDRNTQPTPRNLQGALNASDFKPAQWYYGHHHQLRIDVWPVVEDAESTTFFGCGLHGDFMWDGKAYSV
jgi:hypothetical protein